MTKLWDGFSNTPRIYACGNIWASEQKRGWRLGVRGLPNVAEEKLAGVIDPLGAEECPNTYLSKDNVTFAGAWWVTFV